MKIPARIISVLTLAAASALPLSACNTVEGVGEDVESVGEEIEEETTRALAGAELQERLRAVGTTPSTLTSAQFAEEVRRERAKWAAIINEKNITAD